MKSPTAQKLFLEQEGYRRRRIGDAARFLPFLGGVLVFVPLLWNRDGSDAVSTSNAAIYLFGIWFILIALAAALAPLLKPLDS